MSFLTVLTNSGKCSTTKEDCATQLADWPTYNLADNFAGWLYKKFIREGHSLADAKVKAVTIMTYGAKVVIDVR